MGQDGFYGAFTPHDESLAWWPLVEDDSERLLAVFVPRLGAERLKDLVAEVWEVHGGQYGTSQAHSGQSCALTKRRVVDVLTLHDAWRGGLSCGAV